MPSFHAALAVLFVYANRPPARSFIPVALLNVLMIMSVVPEGGHYLVDLIAGAIIAALSIVLVRAAKGPIEAPVPTRVSTVTPTREI